jgi:hypothetical protein
MKQHIYKHISALLIFTFSMSAHQSNAQVKSSFENVTLTANSYWNGKDTGSGWFKSGNCAFNNKYDTAYGGFWSGWAVSNKKDSTTAGYANQYSTYTIAGQEGGPTFALACQGAVTPTIILDGTSKGKYVKGMWVTNSAYAALDMKNGSGFSKKFGGASGNDSDFFLLTVDGYFNGTKVSKKVDFYLADFRNSDNSKDYILNSWAWVDLSSLGNVDSMKCTLSSSDNGQFGMNTPAYFCMDNLEASEFGVGFNAALTLTINVYPNPTADYIFISNAHEGSVIQLYNMAGRLMNQEILQQDFQAIEVQHLPAGQYIIKATDSKGSYLGKFIKN